MFPTTYLVFDFETTGLKPATDRIIQVGLCRVSESGEVDLDRWLVRQTVPIAPDAAAVHGITAGDLQAHGISPEESLARLLPQLSAAACLVGHNVQSFDVPFLLAECRRLKMPPPRCADIIDTAAHYKGRKLGMSRRKDESHQGYAERVLSVRSRGLTFSISACLSDLKITTNAPDLHDAGGDAFATHLILCALREHLS